MYQILHELLNNSWLVGEKHTVKWHADSTAVLYNFSIKQQPNRSHTQDKERLPHSLGIRSRPILVAVLHIRSSLHPPPNVTNYSHPVQYKPAKNNCQLLLVLRITSVILLTTSWAFISAPASFKCIATSLRSFQIACQRAVLPFWKTWQKNKHLNQLKLNQWMCVEIYHILCV